MTCLLSDENLAVLNPKRVPGSADALGFLARSAYRQELLLTEIRDLLASSVVAAEQVPEPEPEAPKKTRGRKPKT